MQESDPEPTLFVMKQYAYRAWHTNLPMTPAGVWHFYDGRAGIERRIREIREDYALAKIPTRAFEANVIGSAGSISSKNYSLAPVYELFDERACDPRQSRA